MFSTVNSRAKQRYKTAKLNEQVGAKVSTMAVTKRDGNKEDISLEKITNRISVLSNGLEIDPITIAQKAIQGLYDGITTNEIDTYLAETAAALTVEHPDYSYLAGRIKANALHKETPGFVIATKNLFEDGLLREEYHQKVMANAEEIEKIIDYDRDYLFDYFALTTLLEPTSYNLIVKSLSARRTYGCVSHCVYLEINLISIR